MFNPSSSSVPIFTDLSMHHAVSFPSALPTAPTEIPRSGGFFHGKGELFSLPNVAASAPPPYSTSLPSYYNHKSTSSNSFPLHRQFPEPFNGNATFSCPSSSACQVPLPPISSSPPSSSGDLLFSPGTMRRVFSTSDLQGMNVRPSPPPPFTGDNCSQEVGEPFTQKAGRYSAEERKEKIERYRVKRHQRNFHKKITYACRKTLADSRPRVQGRFARNIETEGEVAGDLEMEVSDNNYECSDLTANSITCYNSHGQGQWRENGNSTTFDDSKWWWGTAVAAAAPNGRQQQFGFHDYEEELWAILADMCSGI